MIKSKMSLYVYVVPILFISLVLKKFLLNADLPFYDGKKNYDTHQTPSIESERNLQNKTSKPPYTGRKRQRTYEKAATDIGKYCSKRQHTNGDSCGPSTHSENDGIIITNNNDNFKLNLT